VPQGKPYSYAFTATGSPAPAFSVASGTLPPGLLLDTGTGLLSGTPVVTGTFTFTVRAANGVAPDAVTPVIAIAVAPPVANGADIVVALGAPRATDVGDSITYTIRVANLGPGTAGRVRVRVVLPDGVDLLSASPRQASTTDQHALVWPLPSMVSGSHTVFTVHGAVGEHGALIAHATVTSSSADPNLANNSASVTTFAHYVDAGQPFRTL
jgi:uncharacterized repeat protein (TIGR01451 family)